MITSKGGWKTYILMPGSGKVKHIFCRKPRHLDYEKASDLVQMTYPLWFSVFSSERKRNWA